jgi:GNAT superfamily N-acetyltransferase
MQLIELTHSPAELEKLRSFYVGVYTREFPDADERELRENMERYLQLKAAGWYGLNNYHILLLEDGGAIVGGVVADYFERANVGVIEFMVVDPARRGRGLGKRLLDEITQRFHQDAKRAGRAPLNGVCGEVNDPYRRCDVQEHLDGFARMRLWDRFGFGLLDFPYVQPALSEGQDAVAGLGLMFRPVRDEYRLQVPAELVEHIVADYQIWAMRIENPENHMEFQGMQRYLKSRSGIALLDMRAYVCEEEEAPFHAVEIKDGDAAALEQFTELYQAAFSHDETAVEVSEFSRGTRTVTEGPVPHHYWLWGLAAAGQSALSGLASFFSFPHCGFGGYLALAGSLRSRGYFRRFLRMMERQIVSVNSVARGWYVECEPNSTEAAIFEKCGFTAVPMTYRQPRLHTDRTGISEGKVLALLYKPFGRTYSPPSLSLVELRRDLEEILTRIYYLDTAGLARAMTRMTWPAGPANVFSAEVEFAQS